MSKKKVILSTIAILFVMFAAVSVVSYSIANLGHGDNSSKIEESAITQLGAADSDYITNIDLIIQNAIDNGETFNIVEVVPGDVDGPTDLSEYVANEGFAKYVLSANKSKADGADMPEGKVSYNLVQLNSTTALTDVYAAGGEGTDDDITVQGILDQADLIYFSSPTYDSYDGVFNFTDDIYNYFQKFATIYKKPIIVDYVTSKSDSDTSGLKYKDLVTAIERNYIKYRTFPWKTETSADDFFTGNDSQYLKYYVNYRKDRATGKVLVLTSEGADADSMYQKMSNYKVTVNENEVDGVIKNAYYGQDSKLPEAMDYVVRDIKANPLTVADLDVEYDFILIENDVKSLTISADVYAKLKSLSESSKYILYDARIVEKSSAGNIDILKNNYLKLLAQLVDADTGLESYNNVLAQNASFFGKLNTAQEAGLADAKKVADLINKAIYRDSETSGASEKFRVLEIQPCYPIDTEIAESNPNDSMYNRAGIKGSYYTYPDSILYGYAKDEVPEGKEYYAFELSKAKIAYATGKPYNLIEIDHMSVNQFISTKKGVLESYDLVYIGGDKSAFVPYDLINYTGDSNYTWTQDREKALDSLTCFDMYSHTGTFVDYHISYDKIGIDGFALQGANSVTTNGNDLTTIKRDQLKAYVDAGLPILIDNVVTEAFEESYQYDADNKASTVKASRLQQLELHEIDPDSNMYQFLEYAYGKIQSGEGSNISWGQLNSLTDEVQVDNADRSLGNTIGATATVYNDTVSTMIGTLVNDCRVRPELKMSEFPKNYVEGNASTTNIAQTLTFTASVTSKDTSANAPKEFIMELFIDSNGDGMYLEEAIVSSDCVLGENVTMEFDVGEEFFGLVSWQVKVTEKLPDGSRGVLCDTITGSAFVKSTKDAKKEVRVLQIMPYRNPEIDLDGDYIADYSLYFCTECQQSTKILQNNVTVTAKNHGTGNGNPVPDAGVNSYENSDPSTWDGSVSILTPECSDQCSEAEKSEHRRADFDISTASPEVKKKHTINYVRLGKHEHDFGIVKYDTDTTFDDWESNFADVLTHGTDGTERTGDYSFDLDIVTDAEFEKYCAEAANTTTRTDQSMTDADTYASAALAAYNKTLDKMYTKTWEDKYVEPLNKEMRAAAAEIKNNPSLGGDYAPVIIEYTEEWIKDREYYKFWEYYNNSGATQTSAVSNLQALAQAYEYYRFEYEKLLTLQDNYKLYKRQAGDSKTWLIDNYDVVVLGLADIFAGQDLTQEAANQIKTYVEKGGIVLNSHDALTGEDEKGSEIMTSTLRETFGMDRFHVTDAVIPDASAKVSVSVLDNEKMNYDLNVETRDLVESRYMVAVGSKSQYYGGYEFSATNQDMDITIAGGTDPWSDPEVLVSGNCLAKNNGTVHDSLDDKLVFTFDGGAKLANKAIKIYHYEQSNWKLVKEDTMTANGTYEYNEALQNYTSKTYTQYVGVYKSDMNCDVALNADGSASVAPKDGTKHGIGEELTVTFKIKDADGKPVPDGTLINFHSVDATTVNGEAVIKFNPLAEYKVYSDTIAVNNKNVVYDLDVSYDRLTKTEVSSEASSADTVQFTFNLKGEAALPNMAVSFEYGGTTKTVSATDGVAIIDNVAKAAMPAGTTYIQYNTKDNSKYFWTERLQAASSADYEDVMKTASSLISFNVPIGLSDLYAVYSTKEIGLGQFKYVVSAPESFEHSSNVNGIAYEAKYGTRKAEQVNGGCITFFPFVINQELMISPTHAQVFALDLEDPTITVWYTLAGNYIDSNVSVDDKFSKYSSTFYAASPKDGMSNYFLYSKDNVYYTGAGHQRVTGRLKNNNDERRLFINVIVNSITKAVVKPSLKLYNACDDADGNCEDYYVDKTDAKKNRDLAKEKNTLYYNAGEGVYQYNIDETQTNIYPEFDFKAIEGSSPISKIEVFYDLDYDPNAGTGSAEASDEYYNNANHILIDSYNEDDKMDEQRVRLREDEHPNLLLQDEYFDNYNKYTYIVIRVEDTRGKVSSARVKINIIPYLFDLTDAGSESEYSSFDSILLDMSDRKFNI